MKAYSIGIHRGIEHDNKKESIKKALDLDIDFVEFDVILHKDNLKTGHYYNKPKDDFNEVINSFILEHKKYPKIDIKIKQDNYIQIINRVLENISKTNLKFVLINISGYPKHPSIFYLAERYFTEILFKYNLENKVKLNIDIDRYRYYIHPHLNKIKKFVFSVSPEITSDINKVIELCQVYNIKNVMFWFNENLIKNIDEAKLKQMIIEKSSKVLEKDLNLIFDASIKEYKIIKEVFQQNL